MGRKSPRLQGYDYTQAGLYFITICTQDRWQWFGEVQNGKMNLNPLGLITEVIWQTIPEHYPAIHLDAHVVMPNHVHGIVVIEHNIDPQYQPEGFHQPVQGSIPTIIRNFKSTVSKEINRLHPTVFMVQFPDTPITSPVKLWQSRYYDIIIRDALAFQNIWNYIQTNPAQWQEDRFFR
jgi:REP element-mobilizing transposase RayT